MLGFTVCACVPCAVLIVRGAWFHFCPAPRGGGSFGVRSAGVVQELLVGECEGLPRATRGSVPCGHLGLCQRFWAVSLFARWCAVHRRGVACWACGLCALCGFWALWWGVQGAGWVVQGGYRAQLGEEGLVG